MASGRLLLAAKLRAARQAKGLTQEALAARMNKCQSFVAKYELGIDSLRMHEFFWVVAALGIEPIPVLRAAFGEQTPASEITFPKRLKIEDFFAMANALSADPYALLRRVPVARLARTPAVNTRKIANTWLQQQWPVQERRRKASADHPWRKDWNISYRNRRSVRA